MMTVNPDILPKEEVVSVTSTIEASEMVERRVIASDAGRRHAEFFLRLTPCTLMLTISPFLWFAAC
ncbi:hypothetical protein [Tardiphaga sp. 42S5]|uniref:hypothetical protein n=1 Tax=Tardiphaga sp. 42S5 TaxID=1404799 RepID=UPI002A5A3D45|nr:hypothetical protein [Tardiphaga sp. 42S5]WPO43231.1 hypothetical protein SFY93_08840 [Tardiphaga sp. 42S5]